MISIESFYAAISPVILISILALFFKLDALKIGIISTIFTTFITSFFFKTPLSVIFLSSVDGIITIIPILLVIYGGVILSGILIETGSLKRIVIWLENGAKNSWHNTLLLSVGVVNFLEGAGVIAEPVAAPMLLTSGIDGKASAALSVIGYSGLLTLEMAGALISVLAILTSFEINRLALNVAVYSILPTLLLVYSIPWITGEKGNIVKLLPQLTAAGIIAALGTLFISYSGGVTVAGMIGGIFVIVYFIALGKKGVKLDKSILKDIAPFAFLIFFLSAVNLINPLNKKLSEFAFNVSVIPVHKIIIKPLLSGALYIFGAIIISLFVLRKDSNKLSKVVKTGNLKGLKVILTMSFFGALGQVVSYSGYSENFQYFYQENNMAYILANGLVQYTGSYYPLFAPLLGWIGTFLTGYGIASFMLFSKLQISAAEILNIPPIVLVSGMAIGAGIGSISSPFKIAIATPLCGVEGKEGEILTKTIPLGIVISLLTGLTLFLGY